MGRQKNVIAPHNKKAVVAMDKMAANIEKARRLYGDGEPFDEERVLDCIVFKAEQSSKALNDLGKYCLWLKVEVGYGRFLNGLKRRNINSTAANWAMLMYEKFGSDSAHVQNLGVRRARVLAVFTKEDIATYEKGGPLGSIPHDDVSDMPIQELEAEVRKLRAQQKRTEGVIKEKLRQKDDQITKLELENAGRQLPTKEQLAEAELNKQMKPFNAQIQDAIFAMNNCIDIIAGVQRIDNVGCDQLNAWLVKQSGAIVGLSDTFEELRDAMNDIHIDNGE